MFIICTITSWFDVDLLLT